LNKEKNPKEKEVKELIQQIKQVFQPISSKLKKNKRNLESIQIISGLKPKSKKLKFLTRLIFDEDISNFKSPKMELGSFHNNIVEMFQTKKEHLTRDVKKIDSKKQEKMLRYLELVSGLKPKEIEHLNKMFFKKPSSKQIKKDLKKVRSPKELQQEWLKTSQNYRKIQLLRDIANKKIAELDIKKKSKNKKQDKELKKRSQSVTDRITKQYFSISKKLEDAENEFVAIKNLKNSCITCNQKVTKTYQKKEIKKYEKRIKELKTVKETNEILKRDMLQLSFSISDEEYLPFKDAKQYVNVLMIKSKKEWDQYAILENKIPANIPMYPDITYGSSKNNDSEWVGWADWLGIRQMKFRSFEESREFARKLNIKTKRDWEKFANSGMLPADIPTRPWNVYKEKWVELSTEKHSIKKERKKSTR
jgi:hypothetical protein